MTSWEGCSREIRIEVLQLLTESWEGLFWNTSILQKKGIRRVRNRKQTEVWGDCPCQHSKLISGELLCGKGKKKENHRRVPETSFTDDCPKGLLLGVFCQNEYAYLTCNELWFALASFHDACQLYGKQGTFQKVGHPGSGKAGLSGHHSYYCKYLRIKSDTVLRSPPSASKAITYIRLPEFRARKVILPSPNQLVFYSRSIICLNSVAQSSIKY